MNSKSPSAASIPEATAVRSGVRPVRTIAVGLLLIAVITPLAHFLTILTVNVEVETSSPVGWAVGVIFSLALCGLALRQLARRDWWSRAELALLYTMLAIAVPVMNLGLVRPFFNASHAVLREYLFQGTSTYRTAYNVLDERWFPKVPTRAGLAFNRAERLLRLLEDGELLRAQREARRQLMLTLTDELLLAELQAADAESPLVARLREAIGRLGVDGAQDVKALGKDELLSAVGLLAELDAHFAETARLSEAAREDLWTALEPFDEWAASLLPSNFESLDFSAQERLQQETHRLSDAEAADLEGKVAALAALEPSLRASVSRLSSADRAALRDRLFAREQARIDELSAVAFDAERNQFAFRLSREERRNLIRQNGVDGPNQNLWAVEFSLWPDAQSREARGRAPLSDNLRQLWQQLPWELYLRPLLSWGALFLAIFAFLMCLAEYFRRKWVSRENLAFPLVEVADHIIRHDHCLEEGGDGLKPARRGRAFAPMALLGFGAGFLILFFEALGHYQFVNFQAAVYFDLNENIFDPAGGALRLIPKSVFVLSPIVVGIVFLLSLEVAFSIWMSFLLYAFLAWIVILLFPNIQDSSWTGFGDGRFHPFPMEQMLGACLVFALYLWWKSRDRALVPHTQEECAAAYLPPALTRLGLVLLPVVIAALLWQSGVKSFALIFLLGAVTIALSVAAARVRAETGLPGFHVFYESTKLPIIFGLTGLAGAKAYAAFINVVFLPLSLLFRTLPQQLENLELARRHRIPFRTVAVGTLSAFVAAVGIGLLSFLLFVYYIGQDFYGFSALPPQSGSPSAAGLATYPLWVSHFLGEHGLDQFNHINWIRMTAIGVGAGVVGLLLLLRQKFLRFPLHPVGYLLILLSMHYAWVSPYMRVDAPKFSQTSTLWGGALVAWLLKKLIVKYGGMQTYKQAKPFFISMVIGAVVCIFFWNMVHLGANLWALRIDEPGAFIRRFLELTPYIPAVY